MFITSKIPSCFVMHFELDLAWHPPQCSQPVFSPFLFPPMPSILYTFFLSRPTPGNLYCHLINTLPPFRPEKNALVLSFGQVYPVPTHISSAHTAHSPCIHSSVKVPSDLYEICLPLKLVLRGSLWEPRSHLQDLASGFI